MLSLTDITEISYDLADLVDDFRAMFSIIHEFACPEFNDFPDVPDFRRRYTELHRHYREVLGCSALV